jgi:hypothetical protein
LGEELPQSGSVGSGGLEQDSGGKQSRLVKAFKALSLAVSRHGLRPTVSTAARSLLICSASFLIGSVSLLKALIRLS